MTNELKKELLKMIFAEDELHDIFYSLFHEGCVCFDKYLECNCESKKESLERIYKGYEELASLFKFWQ